MIISKKLSWILRHGATKVGLTYGRGRFLGPSSFVIVRLYLGGFLFLDDVLRLRDFSGITEADVQRVVENNKKQRFELSLDTASGRQKIRAFQGHSVKVSELY